VGLLVILGAGLAVFLLSFPKGEKASTIKIEATPERIARGEYLANHVAACFYCHSTPDYAYYAGPIAPDTKGKGGALIEGEGLGQVYIPNITPAGLGSWTDGEIARAVTAGLDQDGNALFPMMPYTEYRNLPEEDVLAIVAYLRTVPAIPNEVPPSRLAFPLNLIKRTFPKPYEPGPPIALSDTVAYGEHLARISGCAFCHTQHDDRGRPLAGLEFAGGAEIPIETGVAGAEQVVVRSANLTPDEETGIGVWDKAYFIGRFKDYADSAVSHIPVAPGDDNTPMPWAIYAGMTEDDLGAIYTFLRTLEPMKNEVEKRAHPPVSR
jgi:hypothetical protein